MIFGVSVLIASLRMDRLEKQDINPYTIPGLLPGILGIVTILLGFLLALRSWRRLAAHPDEAAIATSGAEKKRILMVIVLCVGFGVGLVGHGLPFWAAAAIFVSIAILCLQHVQRQAAGETLGLRAIAKAVAIGLGAGIVITLVFQELFLVHLP
jgi:cadmium resistance protein CadD (predicted permease)